MRQIVQETVKNRVKLVLDKARSSSSDADSTYFVVIVEMMIVKCRLPKIQMLKVPKPLVVVVEVVVAAVVVQIQIQHFQ